MDKSPLPSSAAAARLTRRLKRTSADQIRGASQQLLLKTSPTNRLNPLIKAILNVQAASTTVKVTQTNGKFRKPKKIGGNSLKSFKPR
jgi:hypothetical protein